MSIRKFVIHAGMAATLVFCGVAGAAESKPGASRNERLPDKLPEQLVPLGDVPQAGVSFASSDAFLQRLYDAAETVCRGNVVRYPNPFDMDILTEKERYQK